MEIWKDIPGFETRYQVSNMGRVKSKSYIRSNGFGLYRTREQILNPFKEKCGYLKVVLNKNGKKSRVKIHRLVAITFIPNPNNKSEIDHINTNVEDNRVDNLRWVTSSENKLNPITRARMAKAKKGANLKPVVCFSKNGILVKAFNSAIEAGETLNISPAHICHCCKGKRNSAGGYRWEYAHTKHNNNGCKNI